MGKRVGFVLKLFWLVLSPLLVYVLFVDTAFAAWGLIGHGTGEDPELILTAAGGVAALLPLGFWYRRERKTSERGPVFPVQLAAAAVAGIGACLFFNGIFFLLPLSGEGYSQARHVLYQPPLWIQLACMGLVIPAGEELVFRGLGYGRLRRELTAKGANILSSAWFGLYHGNLAQGIYAGILGALAAFFYEGSNTLWSCWLFHGAANVTAVLATACFSKEGVWFAAGWEPGAVLFGGLLLAAAGRMLFHLS